MSGAPEAPTPAEVWPCPMGVNDAGAATVGDFLVALLTRLWEEGEGMVKRPFGSSGWQYEVYKALVADGVLEGRLDSDGYVEELDERAARELVASTIRWMGSGS